MRRYFSLIIIAAIAAIGGGYLYNKNATQADRLALDEARMGARRAFAAKVVGAAEEDETADYLRQMKSALDSYESDLKGSVYAKHPDWRNTQAYKDEVELQMKEGRLKEQQYKSMLEGYEFVKAAYDKLSAKAWRPILTAKGKGSTRLDIYDLKTITDDEGQPLLEGKFFLWGVDEGSRIEWGQMSLRYWAKATAKQKKLANEEGDIVLGKAEGEARPRLIIQKPGQYIADFPSNLSIGLIWLPQMPRETTKMDLNLGYTVKRGGGSYDTALAWNDLEVKNSWKLSEGQDWEADEIEATEDEIAGRDEEEEKEEDKK